MATVPATVNNQQLQAPPGGNLATGFSALSIFRQIGLLIGLAASIALGFAVVLWSQEPDYSPLLTSLNNIDATEAVDILRTNEIPYKVDTSTGGLLVATDQLHNARMQLAAVGITNNASVGFELLDRDQGLGTSQFMEGISYRRGLEGELARTISSLNSIRSARVHLAIPKETVFVRDNRRPRASIFVELLSGRKLKEEQISAIVNLVASSVPELDTGDVTIVDQNGSLLSSQGQDQSAVIAAYQFDYTRKVEDNMLKRVQRILEPILGQENFSAEIAADVDFTAVEETEEVYNPDLQVVRSEQTVEEQRTGGALPDGGVPGVLSNQPPGAATAPEQVAAGQEGVTAAATAPTSSRTQATRNYEVDRSISYTKHQQGQVSRLSVAVVVDHVMQQDDTGAQVSAARSQEELDNLTRLVQGAVGFNQQRGDLVTVVNAPFNRIEPEVIEPEEVSMLQQPWVQKLIKQGLAAVLVLLLIFVVIRPIMKSLSNSGGQQKALAVAAANAQYSEHAEQQGQGQIAQSRAGGRQQGLLPGPGQGYDNQLVNAQGVISQDPARAAQVIRQWVSDNDDK